MLLPGDHLQILLLLGSSELGDETRGPEVLVAGGLGEGDPGGIGGRGPALRVQVVAKGVQRALVIEGGGSGGVSVLSVLSGAHRGLVLLSL